MPAKWFLQISFTPSTYTMYKAEDQETATGALLNNSAAITIERTPNSKNTFVLIIAPQRNHTTYKLRKQQYCE